MCVPHPCSVFLDVHFVLCLFWLTYVSDPLRECLQAKRFQASLLLHLCVRSWCNWCASMRIPNQEKKKPVIGLVERLYLECNSRLVSNTPPRKLAARLPRLSISGPIPVCRGDWDVGLRIFWVLAKREPLRNGNFREKQCFARRNKWYLALRRRFSNLDVFKRSASWNILYFSPEISGSYCVLISLA